MPVNRFGSPVSISYAPHELEYLKAADSLIGLEREHAYFDISMMLGRTVSALKEKARLLRVEARHESRAFLGATMGKNWLPEPQEVTSRRVMVPERSADRPTRRPAVAASQDLRPLTEFERQTGRRARPILAAE